MELKGMRTTSATGSSAFTLIELSIVIFIMAMLVALSAPALDLSVPCASFPLPPVNDVRA